MNINEMNIEQIEARMAEIRTEMDAEGADIEALTEEVRQMNDRKAELAAKAKQAEELRKMVSGGAGKVITSRSFGEKREKANTYDRTSDEYRTAWLKNVAVNTNGSKMFGELTEEERAAFTFATANTTALVPKAIEDRIVELVRSQFPIYSDASKSYFEKGFGVPRHKSIDAGDAAKTNEGAAPTDDEQDTFDLLDIPGVEIKKVVEMSRKMKFQSIDAFEDWIVQHIAKRMGVAKEKQIIARLDDSRTGIDSTNVAMSGTLSDAEVLKIMAAIDQDGAKVVYANAKTIWTVIAALENKMGQKLFIPSAMDDALVTGILYGARVKEDANLADNVLYVGVPASILANEFSPLEIFETLEPKTVKTIYTGYQLFDAGLENPKAFVKYTHSPV